MSLRKKLGYPGMIVTFAVLAASFAGAQYPGRTKPKSKSAEAPPTMRSVVVVEWTGDLAKPKASRVVPISVWDGSQLQDGGIYLARPQPLALDGGVEYQLQQNGKPVGLFDIEEAARQQNSWIGFGKFKKLPVKPSEEELARLSAKVKIDQGEDYGDEPVLHRKQHADEAGQNNGAGSGESGQKGPTPDPDRPTLHRGGDSGGDDSGNGSDKASAGSSSGGGPPPDPDRPKLHQDTSTSSGGSGSEDPDRPRLNKTPPANQEANVTSLPEVEDPNRPRLKRGIPEGGGIAVDPSKVETTLMSVPAEMNQQVGVSDSRETKVHTWEFSWGDPDDQRKMKEAVEEAARKALGQTAPAAPPEPPTVPKRTGTAAARRKAEPPPAKPEPAKLLDEKFKVYELAYGAGVTMVFSAQTDGVGADQKFVTIVAQPDLYGSVVVILKNVTDAAHLDVNPRMRLIDAVDADGDNRGELLFELRGQNQRQFGLYRVLRGQAGLVFETTANYFGAAGE